MKKILIVEDEKSLLKALKLKLSNFEIDILSADNISSAVEIIKDNNISLVILDIILPGGSNGFDLLEKIKADEILKLIPVIVLTNLDSEMEVAKKIGASEYLVKSDTTLDVVKRKVVEYLK